MPKRLHPPFLFYYLGAILSDIIGYLAFNFSRSLFVDQVDLSHLQDLGDCCLAYIQPFAKYVFKLQAFSSSSSIKVALSFSRSNTLTHCELDSFVK